jgi:hypothetical protein
MGLLDRIRRKVAAVAPAAARRTKRDSRAERYASRTDEEAGLRARLREDPNDEPAFDALAEIVRRRAEEGHAAVEGADPQKAADDAVWALAEELAQSPRAWHPLVELGRLSIEDDREGALRRFAIAADRDRTGVALAEGLQVLRDAKHYDDALGLGVGHWRPAEHDLSAGRQLVAAAVEAGRLGDARRHLEAMGNHPDKARVAPLRSELELYISEAGQRRTPH